MKKLKFLGVAAMATVLFTSCLDGRNNERSGVTVGVIDMSTDIFKNLAYVDDYTGVYSPQFDALTAGDCVVFPFTINYDDPANNGTNKYLTATVSGYKKLDEGRMSSQVDTTKKSIQKATEITAIDVAIVSASGYGYCTIKNYLFLGSSHPKTAEDQSNEYILQYDPSVTPQVVDGKNVYDFFLRVLKRGDGKGTIGTNTFNYVFKAGYTIDALKNKEKASGKEVLNVRLNYIKEFNKDTTDATWGTSKIFSFPIVKEEK